MLDSFPFRGERGAAVEAIDGAVELLMRLAEVRRRQVRVVQFGQRGIRVSGAGRRGLWDASPTITEKARSALVQRAHGDARVALNALESAATLARSPSGTAGIYLATAPKSNSAYRALLAATRDVRERGALPTPLHLRNAPTGLMKSLGYGADYIYPHDEPGHVADQEYLPSELKERRYYEPGDQGYEQVVRERLEA